MKPCNEKLHVYSVALTVPEQDILAPFEKVEDDISAALALRITIGIGVIIGIVVVFLGGVATAISSSIVVPIKQLLHITRAINSKQLGEEMPEIRAGCSEVSIIYDTFRQLYCVIRFSNDSFFKGDLDAAFAVMDEALTLFRRLGNSKGVGVAQNNRGNILQSFYRRAVKARSKGSNQGAFTSSSAGAYSEPVTAFEAAAEAYEEAVIAAKESLRSHENPGDNPGAGKAVNIEALEAGLEAGAPVATVAVLSMRRQVANRLYNMALLFKAGAENGQAKISQVECATRAKACFEEVSAIDSRPDTHNPTRLVSILGHCAELTILLGISAGGVGGDNVRGDGAGAGAGGFDVLSKAMQLVDRAMSVAATMPVVAIDGSGQAPRSICEQRAMLARAKLAGLAGDKGAEAEGCIAALAHGSASDSLVEREAFQLLAANPSVDADARKRLTCLANPQPPKDVVFVLDVSGSMAGSRLQNAVRNLQKIFNEHCAGDDRVAFVRFNHQSEVVFSLRSMDAAHKVYQRFAESRASSTTAFRDALTDAKTMLTRALPELGQQQRKKWIVALTDGEDNQSRVSLPNMVASLKETASEIQLVTVGLAIRAGTKALAETKALCDATNDGVYISAEGAGSELDEAFAKVADMLAEPSLVVETF